MQYLRCQEIPKKGNRPLIALMLVRGIEITLRVRIKSKKQLDKIMFWVSKICEKVRLVHQKCMKLAVKESNQKERMSYFICERIGLIFLCFGGFYQPSVFTVFPRNPFCDVAFYGVVITYFSVQLVAFSTLIHLCWSVRVCCLCVCKHVFVDTNYWVFP